MGEFLRALSAVFLIFSLMGMGYVLGRLKWLTSSEKKFLSRYVVNIAVPMNCLVGVLNHLKREDLASMGSLLLVPVLCILLSLLLSVIAANLLRLPRARWGVFVSMAFLSNTLFIGLPLSTQLFGEISIPYVMLYFMGSTLFTQTLAVILIERAGTAASKTRHSAASVLRGILTKPPILGVSAAFAMLLLDLRPPTLFMSFAGYLSSTVTPLALMYCGFIVYELGIRNIRMERGIPTMLVIRLFLSPLICTLLCLFFHVEGLTRAVFITEAALPVVSQITVMAGAYGADEDYAATGSILSTLGIFITIPLLMLILP